MWKPLVSLQAYHTGSGQEFAAPGMQERESGLHREWSQAWRAPFLGLISGQPQGKRKQEAVALLLFTVNQFSPLSVGLALPEHWKQWGPEGWGGSPGEQRPRVGRVHRRVLGPMCRQEYTRMSRWKLGSQ